ncbi:hypothetical protein A0H81_05458 [Grifola frondosa]|uniref:Uncharacterized protein n=1 Tax=Grifola frondosa TaxID=5627 RepID=A0A1C7MBL7_GRIFR|nr:hypothetical protein A0H81_05458 [Grifola frondosa]
MSNLPPPSYAGFSSYSEWNPFVRTQTIVDASRTPSTDQTPSEGKFLLMEVHIPPTMDDSGKPTIAHEIITHVDPATHRLAWQNTLPSWFIRAERWQALSTTDDGKTRYETREVFGGIGSYLIKWFLSMNLQKSFEAMAEALKMRAEHDSEQ